MYVHLLHQLGSVHHVNIREYLFLKTGKRFEVEEEASENEKRKSISSSFPAAACLGLICALALAESFYGAALARARTTSEST